MKINQNQFTSVATLSNMIILFIMVACCYSRFKVSPNLISPNIMTEQKGKGYEGISATKTFDHENTRKNFKYVMRCAIWYRSLFGVYMVVRTHENAC